MSAVATIEFPWCPQFPVECIDEVFSVDSPPESGALLSARRNERRLRTWRVRFTPVSHQFARSVRDTLRDAKGGALAVLFTPPGGGGALDVRSRGQATRITYASAGEASVELELEEVR